MRVWEENECKRSTGLTTALSAPRALEEQGCRRLHPNSTSEMCACCDAASQPGSGFGVKKWAAGSSSPPCSPPTWMAKEASSIHSQSWGEGHAKWQRSNIREGWSWSMHTSSDFLFLHPTLHWISLRWPRFAKEMVCWGFGFALGSPGEVLQTVDLWGPFQPKPFCGSILWLFRKHWPHFSEGSSNIEAEVCPLFCNLPRRCK